MHPFRLIHLLTLGLLSFGLSFSNTAHAETYHDQAVVLVAQSGVRDSVWSQTVLLAAPAPAGWHIGLIINRPTERSLASLFPQHEPSKGVREPVFFGGPTGTESLFALVKSAESPGRDSLPLSAGLYLAVNARTIDKVIETAPANARFFVGYVTWRPGELQQESERGFWSVSDPGQRVIFSKDASGLWQELRRAREGLSARLAS